MTETLESATARRTARLERGICQYCGTRAHREGLKSCQLCADSLNERQTSAYADPRKGKHAFICRQCQRPFRSRLKDKIYCTMKCYISSPQFQKRGRDNIVKNCGHAIGKRVEDVCGECGTIRMVTPSRLRTHQARGRKSFCSQRCYRSWMSKRFDRFVANPEQVALPQCYDEFLDRDILRCPIKNCDWEGKFLSCHVNFTHGITAKRFKEMAGFNRKTGLVSKDLSKLMSERIQGHRIKPYNAEALEKAHAACAAMTPEQRTIRLEGKEHYQKAAALRIGVPMNISPEGKERVRVAASKAIRKTRAKGLREGFGVATCVVCGGDFPKNSYGKATICSAACRTKKHYQDWGSPKKWEIECSFCGWQFLGSYMQYKTNEYGKRTYCCKVCRQAGQRLARAK